MSASADPLDTWTLAHFDDPHSLIYGIGNAGRQDDGLGWAFVDLIEADGYCPRAQLHRGYQINLEDADLISRFTRVLFVDATTDPLVASFALTRPEPKLDFSFTSHAISVPAVLATTRQCFGSVPDVRLLAIRGYAWELQTGLTDPARRNLIRSLDHLAGDRSARRIS